MIMASLMTAESPNVQDVQAIYASLVDAALSSNLTQLRQIAADTRVHVRGIEKELADRRRDEALLPALVANATDDEIDLALSELLRRERGLHERWQQVARICRKLEAKARRLRPAAYPLVKQITSTAKGWYRPYLTFLRDFRWKIMALQVERAPDADGPVLANATDIDAYFRSLPPAA
jgi:hypothetical protein